MRKLKINYKIVLGICIIFFLLTNINISYADDISEEDDNTNVAFDENNLEVSTEPTKEPTISSRAAVIIDRKTGLVVYEKNSNDIRKMASTTKIMTAIVVIENTPNLYETVTVSKKAASVGGAVLGLRTNDKITINDLLYGLMLKSGNDTAIALAEAVGGSVEGFAEIMNKKAKEIGLENTHFVTPHGLDSEEHYTTAYELATLANYALNNQKFKEIVGTKMYTVHINGQSVGVSNGNELLGNFAGVYGVKTGFTNGANRCLVTACERDGVDLIAVVLGADTKNIRTKDSMNILKYVYQNFEYVDLESKINKEFLEWNRDNFVEIEKGIDMYADLKLDNITYSQILVNKNNINRIKVELECEQFFESPIYENTKVGEVIVKLGEDEILKTDILIKKTIEKKSILEYLNEIMKSFKKFMVETGI